jgi:hypothetical protein
MAKFLHLLKVVAINLISFLVLLIIVNWACGFMLKSTQATRDQLPNYEKDREHAKDVFKDYNSIQHQYYPFVGWKTRPYNGKTTHINEKGDRVHTASSSGKSEKIVRFFGGSTMWGEGSDDEHTIPALFNKQFPSYAVTNHAQLAYNSRQELDALITLYARNQKADLVIFYDGVNDAAFLCPKEINDLPSHRLVPMFREKLYVGNMKYVKEAFYKFFLENIIRVVRKYSDQSKKESPYDCLSDPNKAEEIAEIMMKNWELAHEIVTSRGGKFVAVLQPAAFVGKPRTDHLKLDEDLKANFAEVYRRLKLKIGQRNHPWIYDLSDKFDRDEYIYIDFCHVSPNGNEIMAKAIGDVVSSF